MTVEISALRLFLAVAEELNFRRAAEREHLAQSALSAQIRRLEAQLGTPLFHRTTRKVELTPAGREVLPAVQQIVAGCDRLPDLARGAARRHARVLRVGLSAAAIDLTTAVFAAFETAHPAVRIEAQPAPFDDPSAGLASGSVDVALIWGPIDETGLDVRVLRREPRGVLLPAAHRLASRTSVHAADLLAETWTDAPARDPVWRDFWLLGAQRNGTEIRLGQVAHSFDGLIELAATGQSISLVPLGVVAGRLPAHVCVIPVVDAPDCVIAVAHRSGADDDAVRAFVAAADRV